MCFRVFVFWFFNKVRQFEDEETRLTDIKTPFLGPGVAAASERAAILDRTTDSLYESCVFEWISWMNDSLTHCMNRVFLNESLEWTIHWLTVWIVCFWMNLLNERFTDSLYESCVFEWISWMNDSLTHCMNRVFLNESLEWTIHWLTVWIVCFWMNLLNEWFTDSLYESCVFEWISWMNDSMTHCMNRVFLNKSLELMIQWLTVWIVCFWTNLLNEWFTDSLYESCVFEWISWMNDSLTHCMNRVYWMNLLNEWFTDSLYESCVFEWISWMNDSMTHCMNRVFLNESLEWMIHWLTVWIVCFWMNLLNEWFTDSLYESCVFEWISWMNDSLTHCMNRVFLNESLEWMIHWLTVWIVCFWMNLLNEWFTDSLYESCVFEWISWMNDSLTHCMNRVFLNESLEWMIQWLTVWIVCFWMNLLNEWFTDKYIFNSPLSPPSGETTQSTNVIWSASYFQKGICFILFATIDINVYIWTINFHPSLFAIVWMWYRNNTV